MNHQLLSEIYQMYHNYKVGWSEVCDRCQSYFYKKKKDKLLGPVPIFHVGKHYNEGHPQLLIYGFVAYGWGSDEGWPQRGQGWESGDASCYPDLYQKIEVRVKELFDQPFGRLFGTIRKICEVIYGDVKSGYERIAISNVVKCNHGEKSMRSLPRPIMSFCANECHEYLIAAREAQILNPTHIVCLTKTDYLKHFSFLDGWRDEMRILVLPHPSFSPRDNSWYAEQVRDFVDGAPKDYYQETIDKNGVRWHFFSTKKY